MTTSTINVSFPTMVASVELAKFPALSKHAIAASLDNEGILQMWCTSAEASALFSINVTADTNIEEFLTLDDDINYKCNTSAAWPQYKSSNGLDSLEFKEAAISKHTTPIESYETDNTTIGQAILFDIAEDYLGDARSLSLLSNEKELQDDLYEKLGTVASTSGDGTMVGAVMKVWADHKETFGSEYTPSTNPAREVLERMQEASESTNPSTHMSVLIAALDARDDVADYVPLEFQKDDVLNFNIILLPQTAVPQMPGATDATLIGHNHVFGVRMTVV